MNRTMCQSNTAIPFANRSNHHPLFFHGVLNIPLRLLHHRPSRNEPRDPPPRGWSTWAASTRDCRPRPTGTTIESMDVRKSKTTFVLCSLLFFLTIRRNKPISWGLAEYNLISPGYGQVYNPWSSCYWRQMVKKRSFTVPSKAQKLIAAAVAG